jgi:hypothetical protein
MIASKVWRRLLRTDGLDTVEGISGCHLFTRMPTYLVGRSVGIHLDASRRLRSVYSQTMNSSETEGAASRPAMIAVGVFLLFGVCMAALAGTTLVWPGTPIDKVWALNRVAHAQLSAAGRLVGGLFLLLSATLLGASVGWFKRRLWGWRLAVGVISTQVVGDVVNLARGDWLRGGVGVMIAGALLLYLLRPDLRTKFR